MPELLKGPVMSTAIGNHGEGTTSVHIWHMTLVTVCHPTRHPSNHSSGEDDVETIKDIPLLIDQPGLHPLYMQQVLDSCRTNREEIAGKVAEDFYVSLLKAIFLKAQGWTVEPALPYKSNNKGISIAQGI